MVILLVCFGLILCMDLVAIMAKMAFGGPNEADLIRVCLTVVLLFFVWLGQRWAVAVLVTLLVVTALFAIFMSLTQAKPVVGAMGVVFIGTAVCLLIPPVQSFLQDQRARRTRKDDVDDDAEG